MGKSRSPKGHQEATGIIQARDEGSLDEEGDRGMERRDEFEVVRGDGISKPCG